MLRKLKTTPLKCYLGDNSLNRIIEAMKQELSTIEPKILVYCETPFSYVFNYHFRADGYPSDREATYSDGSKEVSVYTYE